MPHTTPTPLSVLSLPSMYVGQVDSEMARFQLEKLSDFKRTVVGFINLQLDYSLRIQSTWRELLPRLEEIEADASNSGAAGGGVSTGLGGTVGGSGLGGTVGEVGCPKKLTEPAIPRLGQPCPY